jgi:mannose-6-phosphate isomerase-like protein (cupin superfamily)
VRPTDDEAPTPWVGTVDDLTHTRHGDGYAESLRVPALSMGVFVASVGYDDQQDPHAEDEVYVVASGRAVLEVAGTRSPVGPGSIAFVPAGVPHRFSDISEDVRVLVFFAPAQT